MGESKYNDFRDLEVWKRCKSIRKQFWDVCKNSNSTGIKIIDSMHSGGLRPLHYQESIQYSRQSRGSLYELIDHVDVALECKYLNNNHADSLIEETAIRILNELYQIPERPQRV